MAGREAPAAAWWLDPGWRRLVSVHRLDELDDGDSRDLLLGLGRDRPGRPARASSAAATRWPWPCWPRWTGPVADPDQLSDAPDAVGQLCALILDDVPDEAHRTGLATCAHATRTTQDLLARMVGSARSGGVGVAGVASVRPAGRPSVCTCTTSCGSCSRPSWRTARRPSTSQLHRAVRGYFLERMVDPAEPHPDRAAAEVLLLHRKTPLAAETSVLRDRGQLSVPRAGPAEREEIVALIETNEGSESADLARRWLDCPAPQRLPRSGRQRHGRVRAPGVSARSGRPDGRRPDRGRHLAVRVGARPAASR